MLQNNSHLIAGFFRYHREKLNYSLRGLVGDGKIVDLSSLSAFEHGKKILTNEQLSALFLLIGYDYNNVISSYDFTKEYNEILEYIYLGETKHAKHLFKLSVDQNVFESLGCINFSLLQYVLASANVKGIEMDDACLMFEEFYKDEQLSILHIAQSNDKLNNGYFDEAISLLKESGKISYNPKVRAWISHQFGRIYGMTGNYAEATLALLDAKQRYGEFLGFIRMIQADLNLGNVYSLTKSYEKAEESYEEAFRRSLLLKNSSWLLTKCFNSLCIHYFDTNQYEKVAKLLNNKSAELVESRNTYFVLAWGYYKTGKYEESVRYCEDGLEKFCEYSFVCMVYEYIEKACKGIKTGQDALLRKIIETEDYDNTAEIKELFTYEIIDIYERRKNYEKAFKYAKKLLNR